MVHLPGLPPLIGIASSPNTEAYDLWVSLKFLFRPWQWRNGPHIKKLEDSFRDFFHAKEAISFESGRSALYEILKSLGIGEGDEVLLQAYTCVVVPDAIVWAGAKPIYIDVGDDFNINPTAIRSKITSRTKAIIVQHTFGHPAALDKIIPLAKSAGIYLIEDCAHVIGGKFLGKLLGTFGHAAFFSFGQEKAISSVRGGMVITNNATLGKRIRDSQLGLPYPSFIDIKKRLLHPVIWRIINSTYYFFNFGKVLMVLAKVFRLTGPLVSDIEVQGVRPPHFPLRLPNAQAAQALAQFHRIKKFNRRRLEISRIYQENFLYKNKLRLPLVTDAPLLRYTVKVSDPGSLRAHLKKFHIIAGNWYEGAIYPKESKLSAVSYSKGSCPKAEKIAAESVNLPLSPTMSDQDSLRVTEAVLEYVKEK